MVIYLPGQNVDEEPLLDELTPREIVRELDKHVVGQQDAKRAVAVALRNRIRRQKLPPEMAEEVMPKNILMIGPTGVGKTEIARRLAKLANSPFLKVEASKFTEVGYVGEFARLDLQERRIGQLRQPPRNLGLPHAGRPDHEDVFRHDLFGHFGGQFLPPNAVAERHC